jgi:ComF family protein
MFLKDLLFPKTCLCCGYLGAYICLACQKNLYKIKKYSCLYCERASPNGFTHQGCLRKNGIDGFISVFYYDNRLKKIIKEIKYRRVKQGLKELLLLINHEPLKKLKTIITKNTYLQPIPLYSTKEKERGFNQAELIVYRLSRLLNIPTIHLLKRVRPTVAQAQLESKKERVENIRQAFQVVNKEDNKEKNIILIDDVVTTGSTVKEAAKTLKKAGVSRVDVFTLAKG